MQPPLPRLEPRPDGDGTSRATALQPAASVPDSGGGVRHRGPAADPEPAPPAPERRERVGERPPATAPRLEPAPNREQQTIFHTTERVESETFVDRLVVQPRIERVQSAPAPQAPSLLGHETERETASEPVIHVSIGRIEVRATPAAARPRQAPPASDAQPERLEDYLRSRRDRS